MTVTFFFFFFFERCMGRLVLFGDSTSAEMEPLC